MSQFRWITVIVAVCAPLAISSSALASGGSTLSAPCAKLSFSNGNFSVQADGTKSLSFTGTVENCGSMQESLALNFASLAATPDFAAYDWNAPGPSMVLAPHTSGSFYATPLGISTYTPGYTYNIRVSTRLFDTASVLSSRDFAITAPA